MKKPKAVMNKPVYLSFSIFTSEKKKLHEVRYGYITKHYGAQTQVFYIYTSNFITNVKSEYFYEYVKDYVEKRILL